MRLAVCRVVCGRRRGSNRGAELDAIVASCKLILTAELTIALCNADAKPSEEAEGTPVPL